jgi:hypothetical protein
MTRILSMREDVVMARSLPLSFPTAARAVDRESSNFARRNLEVWIPGRTTVRRE